MSPATAPVASVAGTKEKLVMSRPKPSVIKMSELLLMRVTSKFVNPPSTDVRSFVLSFAAKSAMEVTAKLFMLTAVPFTKAVKLNLGLAVEPSFSPAITTSVDVFGVSLPRSNPLSCIAPAAIDDFSEAIRPVSNTAGIGTDGMAKPLAS